MRLRPGHDPSDVAKKLREVAQPGNPFGGSLLILNHGELVNAFAAWINDLERTLCHYFVDPDVGALHTERYWRIASGNPPVTLPRFPESASAEASWQFNRIIAIAEELEGEVERLRGDREARIAVVDTNVFLHCRPLEDFVDWSFVGAGRIRVVVPVRVIEELDSKKRDRNPDIADRGRRSIRWLTEKLVPKNGGPVNLRPGVTLESYTPNGRRENIPSADTEILEACEQLETFAAVPVSIVTSDLGMQLRAMNAGTRVCVAPDTYRLDQP